MSVIERAVASIKNKNYSFVLLKIVLQTQKDFSHLLFITLDELARLLASMTLLSQPEKK